jgi:predicted dehydrogenase
MSEATGRGVAVVGTSFGCITHVRAARAAGLDVVALVGRDPARTTERAERFAVPFATTSLADALARPDIDAVAVATPPHTHGAIALDAIAAGKHVLCEKPFAADLDEARRMLHAAEAAGVVHLLGTEFRWAPGQALMRRLVLDGSIGDPRLATFLLHIPLLADPGAVVPDWWSDAAQGGGWLGAHGSHVIDQIRSTLGELEGVSATLPVLADRAWTAEDTYTVHFRLRAGGQGVLQATAADWGSILMVSRISGTAGAVWTEGDAVWLADATGTRQVPVPEDLAPRPSEPPPGDLLVSHYDLLHSTGMDLGPYTRLYEVFGALMDGEPVPTDPAPATFADGVANMVALDAIRRAARDRTWIAVDS